MLILYSNPFAKKVQLVKLYLATCLYGVGGPAAALKIPPGIRY